MAPLTDAQAPPAAPGPARTDREHLPIALAVAACGVLVFHLVSLASGTITIGDGLGWDGRAYAGMVTAGLTEGHPNTQMRPLLPLVTRIPYLLGVGIRESFQTLNYLYAFLLYGFVGLLLGRYGADVRTRFLVVGNLALCIATSKMFGFYPTHIDLGALAIVTMAFYFVVTDRLWPAAVACVLAVASREFGVAAALFGIHRSARQGLGWGRTALAYGPALAAAVLIRTWVVATAPDDVPPLRVDDAMANLELWISPAFIAYFAYFGLVIFGGISVLLALRPGWCLDRLRREPEVATYLVVIVGLTAAGSFDVWRYLVFALPAVVVLIAQYFRTLEPQHRPRVLAAMTLVTVLTQRPFERMNEALYFRDWFPLYQVFRIERPEDFAPVWIVRFVALLLVVAALWVTLYRTWGLARRADAHRA